jgi:hypothetical protein
MTEISSFDLLREKRLRYIESARENEFEEGLKGLLSELYPDNAHFIYELLQNAEDALATTVEFTLTGDRLKVTHDGKRPFTLKDIESITGIGKSTKKDDPTQIGKFGVGFKAVFAYTTRPEVRSGEHAFAIVDLFVPEEIPDRAKPGKTNFTFPFDRAEKPPEVACAEVERGLSLLDEKTLLFLNNISTITYELPDGTVGIIGRQAIDERVIRIKKSAGDRFVESQWLRLTGSVSVDQKGPSPLTVAAAFLMEPDDGTRPKRGSKTDDGRATSRIGTIVPLEEGDVSIYFPAVKESSGLRFHIHAPFASTVARDSVRDDPGNVRLVDDIASIIVNALPGLCAEGLIGDTFLAALPNSDDQIGYPYTRIRDAITEAFNSLEITPVRGSGGAFSTARALASSPVEFRTGLDPSDLPVLFELAGIEVEQSPRWIRELDGRAGKFLAGLDAIDFGWSELDSALDMAQDVGNPKDADVQSWLKWLETKPDERIADLYGLIGQGRVSYRLTEADLQTVPMVRLHRRGKVEHVKGPDTYLPAGRSDKVQSRVPVTLAYFDDDEDEPRASRLKAFYRAAGVKRWDEHAKIEQRLAVYRDGSPPFTMPDDLDQHLDDVRRFVQFGLANQTTARGFFGQVTILQAVQSDGSDRWVTPRQTFVDLPFRDTGLSALYPRVALRWSDGSGFAYDREPYPLAGYYSEVEGIEEFLEIVGAQVGIVITKANVNENAQLSWSWRANNRETRQGVKIDWGIELLERMIESGSPTLLRTLWHAVQSSPDSKAIAFYQANGAARKYTIDSQLAQVLKARPWILDRYGALRTPREMTNDDLPDDWAKPTGDCLVMKLDFGLNASARRQREESHTLQLRRLGIDEEVLAAFGEMEAAGLSPADLRDWIRERSATSQFPGGASDDPDRRAAIAALDALNAPNHATEVRERSVVIGQKQSADDSKAYLREHYTSDSDGMICQACQKPLPFKTNDGRWYFEALRFVTGRRQIHVANAIALCPLCAALYKYARDTKDELLLKHISVTTIDGSQDTLEVPVVLDGKRVKILFTIRHAIDLQSALGVAGDARDS